MIERQLPVQSPGWKQLLQLGEQLLGQPNAPAQCDLIISAARKLLYCEARVWLVQPTHILPGWEEVDFYSPDPPTRLMNSAYQKRRIYYASGEDEKAMRSYTADTRSIAVPLATQESVFGVLQVDRPNGPAFDLSDIDLVNSLAAHAALALQVARQAEIKNWRIEQLSLVRSVSAQIANALDLDELAQRVTRSILDTFKYYFVAIFTLDASRGGLVFRASASLEGQKNNGQPVSFKARLGQGIVGVAAEQGIEVLASDVTKELHYRRIQSLPATRSEVALPLKIENRVLGVLDVQSEQVDAFHEMDLLVLRALADNVAIAVEDASLYTRLRRRADQLAAIGEVSRAITSILDQDKLLNEVVALIHKRFGYPSVHLFSVYSLRRKVIYQAGSGKRSQSLRKAGLEYDLDDTLGIIPWVARNGTSLLANDVRREPRYRPASFRQERTRSELAVPFIYAGEILGVLDVQSDQLNAFDEDDRTLFEALADNIAISLHNASLYRSEQWRRQVAESLLEVAGLLSSNLALDQVLDAILVELERNLPCDVSAIWLLEQRPAAGKSPLADHLQLAAARGVNRDAIIHALDSSQEVRDWLGKALAAEHPIIRLPSDPSGPLGVAMGYEPSYSSVAAPLRVGNQPVGILALGHPTTGRYGVQARSMTAAFASYASVAIENTRLYAAAQEEAWVSTVMLQVAEAAQSYNNIDELLPTIVRLIPLLVGVKGCALFLWDAWGEAFVLSAIYGLSPAHQVEYTHRQVPLGRIPAFDQLYFGKAPVIIQDAVQELHLAESVVQMLETNQMVLIPMMARGEIQGALLVEHHSPDFAFQAADTFDDDQMAILQGIAQQTAVAVENIRLLEAKQEEAYVTAVLLQVAQAVVGFSELDDILASIVHIMPVLVGIDRCVIYLWNTTDEVFQPSQAYAGERPIEEEILARSYAPDEFPLLRTVLQNDQQIISPLENPSKDPTDWPSLPVPMNDEDKSSHLHREGSLLIACPLSVKGDVFGVLVAQDGSAPGAFRERRLEIINGIAQQAALAIQNDRLQKEMIGRERLEREFQLAREIQQNFLPEKLPVLQGWEIDARWRPARQVAGDFYDIFDLPGKRLGLVVADVSDKGMPAALYMTVTRTLIRAAVRNELSPAGVLRHVNELLLADTPSGMFITTFYAVISLESGEVVYANAGHNRPFLIQHGKHGLRQLFKGGTALGVDQGIQPIDHTDIFEPGDTLLLYTDGVTEAFSPADEIYGEERLVDVLLKMQNTTPSGLLDEIDRSLREFQGSEAPSDDITLLAIRRAARSKAPRTSTAKEMREKADHYQDHGQDN